MRGLATLLLLVFASLARSEDVCECIWRGSFSEVQAGTDLVISGTVVDARGNSIDLRIDRSLRGDTAADPVRVWLKTGSYCRPDPELFPADSSWVMALNRIDEDVPGGFDPNTPNVSYGRVGDYILSSCGGYYLKVADGDWVTGNLVKGAPRWAYEPKMTPVLIDLLADYVDGKVGAEALLEASKEDPALRELRLNTREFLRQIR